jgi:hypothetical protein
MVHGDAIIALKMVMHLYGRWRCNNCIDDGDAIALKMGPVMAIV